MEDKRIEALAKIVWPSCNSMTEGSQQLLYAGMREALVKAGFINEIERESESRITYKQDGFPEMTVKAMPGDHLDLFNSLRKDPNIEWARYERRDVQPWEVVDTYTRSYSQ